MKRKRILSILLTACMLLSLIPASILPVRAAADPVYNRVPTPEMAILNYYTGNHETFLKQQISSPIYNAVANLKFARTGDDTKLLSYEDTISKDTAYYWKGFWRTNLAYLSDRYQELQCGLAVTRKSNSHTHRWKLIYSADMTSYMNAYCYLEDTNLNQTWSIAMYRSFSSASSTTREGVKKYSSLGYTVNGANSRYVTINGVPQKDIKKNLYISFSNSMLYYDGQSKTCTCGGTATGAMVSFYDGRVPSISSVEFQDKNGKPCTNFKNGDVVNIVLKCTDAIRFADDSAVGKDVYIGLMVEGLERRLYARLTRLDENSMTFTYTVDTQGVNTINGIDLTAGPTADKALVHKTADIELKQIYGGSSNKTYSPKLPDDNTDPLGFTMTTSYVTDIAGNAFAYVTNWEEFTTSDVYLLGKNSRVYLDCEAPFVAKAFISPNADYNKDVKTVLGKTDLSPASTEYADNSDTYLGVGDAFSLTLYMNEKVTYPTDPNASDRLADGAVQITTNIKQGSGYLVLNAVSVASASKDSVGDQYGLGASKGEVTVFRTAPVTIDAAMTISGGEGIKITGVTFTGVADASANAAGNSISASALAVDYQLDTVGAAPDLEPAVQTGGPNSDFYVSFTLSDAGSGVDELPGTLTLSCGKRCNSFQYALTFDGETPENWETGTMGTAIPFIQTNAKRVLHIRPLSKETYAFYGDDARLVFSLSDYAGNKCEVTATLTGVILDNLSPTAAPGNSTRNYSGTEGILTADFQVSDPGGVTKVEIQWSAYTVDSDTELIDVNWTTDGVNGALSDSSGMPLTNPNLTVTATVPAQTDFWQRLWVRATDRAGNTGIIDLGEYRYNLSNIQYDLEYPTGITSKLSMYLRSLEDDGKLVLAARKAGTDDCYVLYLDKTTSFLGSEDYNLLFTTFGSDALVNNWYTATPAQVSTETVYTLESSVNNLSEYLYAFTGEVEITVYSGRDMMISTGTDSSSKTTVTVTGGAAKEIVILRCSDEKNTLSDVFDGTNILSMSDPDLSAVTAYVSGYPWRYQDQNGVSATLEGKQVYINLGNDVNGWRFKDVKWTESFLALYPYNYGEPNDKTLNEMKPFKLCAIGSGPSQTVTLPASDLYQSGRYMLVLVLVRNSAPDKFYYAVLKNSENTANALIHLDTTPAGTLSLGALYRETTEIGGYIEEIPYDPNSTIYIPSEGNMVRLMVEALNADGSYIDFHNDLYNIGAMDILAWNTTTDPSVKISLDGADANSTGGHRQLNLAAATGDRYEGILGVTPGVKNVIALQVRWANGETSAVTYLTVLPMTMDLTGEVAALPAVDESLYGPFNEDTTSGLLTTNPGEARIVFTPKTGSSTAGLRLFCQPGAIYHSATEPAYGTFAYAGSLGEMTPQSDGTFVYTVPAADAEAYRAAVDANMADPDNNPYPDRWYTGILLPDGSGESTMASADNVPAGYYVVFAQDAYGNQRVLGITQGAVVPDGSAPLVTGDSLTTDAGSYTATFTIRDDSLFSFGRDENWKDRPVSRPLTLTLAYDDAYAALIGAKGESVTLTADASGGTYTWTDAGSNKLGVCKVTAVLTRSGYFEGDDYMDTYYHGATDAYLTVTVEGAVSSLVRAGTSMTLSLTAEDAHGNRADPVELTGTVSGMAPAVTAMQYKETGTGTDRALYLTFNTPVQPEASWICPDPQGFSTVWNDAFPIWKDGTWTISFRDIFGTRYTQEITLTDVFGSYGIDLGFSTLEYTPEPVIITALADEDGETVVVVGGDTVSVNGDYIILRVAGQDEDELTVHITNIVDGAPAVTLYFYLEEFKEEYAAGAADQFKGVTTAPVVVSYRTDRQTSPDGETTLTLKNEGDDSTVFTFRYYDVPTDEFYSVSFKLKDYGITLAPATAAKDTQAPVVSLVTVWTQRGSGFVQAEAFPGSAGDADVESAIDNSGFAHSYDFVVNAADRSGWKVTVAAAEPGTMRFSDEGDQIEGVTVQGNNVLVTDQVRQDFWIVVTDNAAEETGADGDNFTCIRIPYGAYRFDTTPPTIKTLTVADSMYQKSVYLKAADVDDAGTDTGTVTLTGAGIIANPDAAYKDYPWKLTFTDNDTTVAVTATDGAGNSTVQQIHVSGIDVTAPVLYVTWSPCFKDPNTGKLDQTNPSAGPVNTDVVAHITSSKEILDVTAAYTVSGTETDYDFAQGAGWGRIEFTSQRVSVFFTDPADDLTVRVTVKAPNGKTEEVRFTLNKGVIDKVKPAVVSHVTEQDIRTGYSVPFGETHSLTFSEDVYCMNYGQAGLAYNGDRPFTMSLTENGSEVLQFADKAGNLTTITLTAAGLDSAPPLLRLDVPDRADATNSPVAVTVTTDEPCTLRCADPSVTVPALTEATDAEGNTVWTGTLSVGKNGVFRLIAADSAGNEASATFTVYNIDRTLPNIHFESSTISLRQNSEAGDLTARLDAGVTIWDNVEVLGDTLNYDMSQVLLDTPGVYPVTYTVEDSAGNLGQAVRYVKIIDKNLPVIAIDGELTEPNGTTNLYAGQHVLAVSGLKTPDEPYTLQLVKGLRSAGQMKRAGVGLTVGEDGSFTLTETGYYTLYIITQSRLTYRTLLYVEN